jgi:DtxR family Mn-dependent transcriptional regulator
MIMIKKQISASLEDYLEAIYNLSQEGKVARSRDIAQVLGVAPASVSGALKLLNNKELIDYQPYGYIRMTDKGYQLAKTVVERHNIIMTFFVNVLGVEKEEAEKVACKAEHTLGSEIISKLLNFTEFSTFYNDNGVDIPAEFKKYCRSKGL